MVVKRTAKKKAVKRTKKAVKKRNASTPKSKIFKTKKSVKKILRSINPEPYTPHQDAILAVFENERVLTENSAQAKELFDKSRYGILTASGKVQLSLTEAYYLLQRGKLTVLDGRNAPLSPESFVRKAKKIEPNFWIRYCVFRDFRDRGYIIKTALKFGADFRVYERGIKPGEDHAKWIVYPVHEASTVTWYEFAAKNRVAHSTKKKILIAVVDDEDDVSFWEVRWKRP